MALKFVQVAGVALKFVQVAGVAQKFVQVAGVALKFVQVAGVALKFVQVAGVALKFVQVAGVALKFLQVAEQWGVWLSEYMVQPETEEPASVHESRPVHTGISISGPQEVSISCYVIGYIFYD